MVSIVIIVFTVLISFYSFSNKMSFDKLSFKPYAIHNEKDEWYRFLSYGFVHADIGHLLFNMLSFYFFSSEIEGRYMNSSEFLIFYITALIVSTLPTYQKQKQNEQYVAVGASGAVSSVIFFLVLFSPWSLVYIKFIIPVYFILFAVGYIAYSTYMSRKNTDNIGHDVHLWGALYGIAYALIIHPESLKTFIHEIKNAPFL